MSCNYVFVRSAFNGLLNFLDGEDSSFDITGKVVDLSDLQSEGGTDGGDGGNVFAYPNPKSFQFSTKKGSKKVWQEAAVTGLYFDVFLSRSGPNGITMEYDFRVVFPQAILFTVPTMLDVGKTPISREIAAEETARIIQSVIWDTVKKFLGTNSAEMYIKQYFERRLKAEYPMGIPGARVNFNSMYHTVTPEVFTHN